MSAIPRSLQRRSSHPSSSSRRYRIIFSLVATTTLLLTALHIHSDQSYAFSTTAEFDPIAAEDVTLDPKLSLGVLHNETRPHPWSYVTEEYGSDAWRWVGKQRAEGYRRPSWGGMKQQGPKANVRSNMLDGEHYLTTFPEAGFNNEVIETCNLIAVALRSGRIPVLAPLIPDDLHLRHKDSFLSVTEIFDFTDFIAQYNVPVVDLLELKIGDEDWITIDERHRSVVYDGEHPQMENGEPLYPGDIIQAEKPGLDKLVCWNTYLAVDKDQGGHIGTLWPAVIEQTPLPISAYANDRPFDDQWISTISLPRTAEAVAAFSNPGDMLPDDVVARLEELDRDPSNMAPNDPFGCLHRSYYLHMNPETEDIHDDWRNGVGAWDEVGKYLKFQPGLTKLSEDLLRDLMDVGSGQMPPYMAVHIRRTDFADNYRHTTQRDWAHQAWKLLHEIKDRQGIDVRHIVFTTDEEDEEWLRELRNLGWIHVDHAKARTGDKLGWWFPTLIDSVILSSSKVFLGVPTSTMSILPYRRVLEWNGGIARFIHDPTIYSTPTDWEWARDW